MSSDTTATTARTVQNCLTDLVTPTMHRRESDARVPNGGEIVDLLEELVNMKDVPPALKQEVNMILERAEKKKTKTEEFYGKKYSGNWIKGFANGRNSNYTKRQYVVHHDMYHFFSLSEDEINALAAVCKTVRLEFVHNKADLERIEEDLSTFFGTMSRDSDGVTTRLEFELYEKCGVFNKYDKSVYVAPVETDEQKFIQVLAFAKQTFTTVNEEALRAAFPEAKFGKDAGRKRPCF